MNEMATAALIAWMSAFALTPLCRAWARRRGILDIPNDASSHSAPTPRTGGFAIVAGLLAGVFAGGGLREERGIALLAVAVVVASFATVDEFRPLPRLMRLFIQLGIAVLVLAVAPGLALHQIEIAGFMLPLGSAGGVFVVVWLVGSINGFNFMDGLNGLAASAAIVCGCTIATLASMRGDALGAILGAAIAAAAAGFLPWNVPSGSIFMGDVGSATLGFLISVATLHLTQVGVPFTAAALPLVSFLSDAFITVIRRAGARERFFATRHRSHYYQLLHAQGWSHAAVTVLWTMLMTTAAVAAIMYERLSAGGRATAVALVVAAHAAVFMTVALRQRRRR